MDVDTETLITAVECKRILWDESQDLNKDTSKTKNSWKKCMVH